MRNSNDENKAFIKACQKAGLKVQPKENSKIVEGLVIVDARGTNYTVNTDGKIKRVGISVTDGFNAYHRIARVAGVARRIDSQNRLKGYKVARHGRILKKQED